MDTFGRYLDGVRLLGRGTRMYARTPRLLVLGLIPAVLAAVLFFAALVVLLYALPDLAAGATWFAADWSQTFRTLIRVLAGIGILGVSLVVGVFTFTAFTMFIGDPFYERISRWVEGQHGGVPGEVEIGFWGGLGHSLADSARLLAVTVLIGVPLFFAGFIPLVGQTVIPVIGATVGGWFLALQLVGVPFTRRGLRLADRRRLLGARRPETLGFGTAVFLCFLIPGGAVLMMPAAVAGGTLLARLALSPAPARAGQDAGTAGYR